MAVLVFIAMKTSTRVSPQEKSRTVPKNIVNNETITTSTATMPPRLQPTPAQEVEFHDEPDLEGDEYDAQPAQEGEEGALGVDEVEDRPDDDAAHDVPGYAENPRCLARIPQTLEATRGTPNSSIASSATTLTGAPRRLP